MKKVLFTLVMSIFGVMSMCAQDELVATLIGDEGSKQFYGKNAFVEAYEASKNGDQII